MSQRFHPSGDILADRRYALAADLLDDGDAAAAADLLDQTMERVPDWVPGWMALGAAEERQGRLEAAATAYAQAETLDVYGQFGAGLHVVRLRGGLAPAVMPTAYVAAVFDAYASRFDHHLVDALGYRAPAVMARALNDACGDRGFGPALDLGCGTGLMGAAIADKVEAIDGVDLSSAMLEVARRTGFYRSLRTEEIGRHLAGLRASSYDLVLAADVFAYLGALDSVIRDIARVLTPGGVVAFTAQRGTHAPVHLGPDLRFSHSSPYVRHVVAQAGLEGLTFAEASFRRERGEDVPGLVVVARKAYL